MIRTDTLASPNAALKFARWLEAHPLGSPASEVRPQRPAWIARSRPRLKALIESPRRS